MGSDEVNPTGFEHIPVLVTHEGQGLHGVVRALNDAGYYAIIAGLGENVAILYGPRGEHLNHRVPYVALVGDTIRVSDRSKDQCQSQH